jgi:hypothetical protein
MEKFYNFLSPNLWIPNWIRFRIKTNADAQHLILEHGTIGTLQGTYMYTE